jgi:alpha-mannosidase
MGESRSLLLLLAVCSFLLLPSPTVSTLVYNTSAEPVAGKLNIHLVAHTHDDLGWLQTVDQYYVGPDATRDKSLNWVVSL